MTQTEKVYKKNFLTNVIFRVDFPKILELTDKMSPSEFQKTISSEFPLLNEIQKSLFEYRLELKEETQPQPKRENMITWEFFNKDKTKRVFVDSEFLILEYMKYQHFSEFLADIELIFTAFTKFYPLKIAKRIGLRYVNQININSGDAFDWKNLLGENLFSSTNEFKLQGNDISRSIHFIELKKEDCNLKFQFGFFNSEYPNPIAKKEFVLDYYCSTNEEFEVSEIVNKAKRFNKVIYEQFEKSILDGLRKEMEVVENE